MEQFSERIKNFCIKNKIEFTESVIHNKKIIKRILQGSIDDIFLVEAGGSYAVLKIYNHRDIYWSGRLEREAFALNEFSQIGLTPRVYSISENSILMEFCKGESSVQEKEVLKNSSIIFETLKKNT